MVGSGDCGQLGMGPDVVERERFGRLSYFNDKNICHVSAGGLHNMALSTSGKVTNSCNGFITFFDFKKSNLIIFSFS